MGVALISPAAYTQVPGSQKLRAVIVSESTGIWAAAVSEEIIGKASGKFTAHSGSCGVTHLPLGYSSLVRDLFCLLLLSWEKKEMTCLPDPGTIN